MGLITLSPDILPEVAEWEPGQNYEVTLDVEMVDDETQDYAFEVRHATGHQIMEEDLPPEADEGDELPGLETAYDEAVTDVMGPAEGPAV